MLPDLGWMSHERLLDKRMRAQLMLGLSRFGHVARSRQRPLAPRGVVSVQDGCGGRFLAWA
jgi:hypothetical protein